MTVVLQPVQCQQTASSSGTLYRCLLRDEKHSNPNAAELLLIICFYRSNPVPLASTETLQGVISLCTGNHRRELCKGDACIVWVYWDKDWSLTGSAGKTTEQFPNEIRSLRPDWDSVTCCPRGWSQKLSCRGGVKTEKERKRPRKWQKVAIIITKKDNYTNWEYLCRTLWIQQSCRDSRSVRINTW